VLAKPSRFPKQADFELLLTSASPAYELRTGNSPEHLTPVSYEPGSTTEGWASR